MVMNMLLNGCRICRWIYLAAVILLLDMLNIAMGLYVFMTAGFNMSSSFENSMMVVDMI